MEEKLFNKFIEKEISKEEDLILPTTIDLKLNEAYELIRGEEGSIDSLDKYKSNKPKRKRIIAAASLVFVLLTAVIATPALADNIPPLKEISQYLKHIYFFNDNYIAHASEINRSKEFDGIEVNLQGVIYDETSLKFIYTVTSDKNLQWGVQLRNNSLKIDGKEVLEKQAYSMREGTDSTKISKEGDKKEKYAVITTYDISDLKLDDTVNIDWAINEIHTQNYKFAQGDWDFDFKISKKLLKENSKIFDVNYSKNIDGYKFTINKVIFTPIETTIISTGDPKLYADINKELKTKQGLSEKLKQIDEEVSYRGFNICDENGNALEETGSSMNNDKNVVKFRPVDKIPNKLIFTPISEKLRMSSNCIPKDDQYIPLKDVKAPFEYNQGKNMSFTINSIERNDNKLKVNVSFKGDFVEFRARVPFEVVPKGVKSTALDSQLYDSEAFKTRKVSSWDYYEKASDKNNTFDYDFELKDNEDYNMVFKKYDDGFFMRDKQFEVNLK